VISNTINNELQIQPCGIDLTLNKIFTWTSTGTIDFDNSARKNSETEEISLDAVIPKGAYLVEFNEVMEVPLNIMGEIYTRSSLLRSGASLCGGVIDSGFKGIIKVLFQVCNPNGIKLTKNGVTVTTRLRHYPAY